jgi:hypothetical protein
LLPYSILIIGALFSRIANKLFDRKLFGIFECKKQAFGRGLIGKRLL